MWILPKNHSLYSVYAQDFYSDLTEDLKEHWEESPEPLLMWKSKLLSWPILLRAWKRVYWMRYLCGRILKPSLGPSFEEKWIGSLEDTHASRLAMQENGEGQKIPVTSGHILPKVSEQYKWEEPRTTKPGMGCTVNGYNFREDILRGEGNGVVWQTAELAFRILLKKHLNGSTNTR